MRYEKHPDFMRSLYDFHRKQKKLANKVLVAWAKSQANDLFCDNDVFSDLRPTSENRIRHCVKYTLNNNARLVTVKDQNVCMFLFVGTHDETEYWLDKNKGNKFIDNSVCGEMQQALSVKPVKNYMVNWQGANDLVLLRKELAEIRRNLRNDQEFFGLSNRFDSKNNTKQLRKVTGDFVKNDVILFKGNLNKIQFFAQSRLTDSALKKAEDLELFAEFFNLKVTYIHKLKKFIDITRTACHN